MNKSRLKEIFEEIVRKHESFLIEAVFRGADKKPVIELFVDNVDGVSTDLCSKIISDINEKIEQEELITSSYRLDVSSPGADRPLKYLEQYQKHINRKFEVKYSVDDDVKKFNGKLLRINKEKLIFESGTSEIEIDFDTVKSAKVLISF